MEMTLANVIGVLNDTLEETNLTEDSLDVDLSECGVDSLRFVQLVVSLEEAFGVEVPDSKLIFSEMNTIEKIWGVLKELTPEEDL